MIHAFLDWDKPPLAIVADKAYGSTKIRKQVADEGALCVVPAKSNALKPVPHGANLYAMRDIVERFFCKIKDMRRLSTRFEKYAQNFLAMLHLSSLAHKSAKVVLDYHLQVAAFVPLRHRGERPWTKKFTSCWEISSTDNGPSSFLHRAGQLSAPARANAAMRMSST